MKINKLLRWIIFLPCIIFIFSGCSNTETDHTFIIDGTTEVQEIIAVYDIPKILVPYDEIINTYHLRYKDDQFSMREIEVIFNLVKSFKDDPKVKELNVDIHLKKIYIWRDSTFIHVSTTTYNYGPTSAAGYIIYLYQRSDGKYELIKISNWVS